MGRALILAGRFGVKIHWCFGSEGQDLLQGLRLGNSWTDCASEDEVDGVSKVHVFSRRILAGFESGRCLAKVGTS